MRNLRSILILAGATIIAASIASCKAVSRTIGTSGAHDVTPQRFIEAYEQPGRDDAYWEYIGAVGNHYYMEYYRTIDKTYPEFAGEIRVPIRSMPADFPAVPPGRPYPEYTLPDRALPDATPPS